MRREDRGFRAIMAVLGGVVSAVTGFALRAWWPVLQSTAIAPILWYAAIFSFGVACVWGGFRWPRLLGMGHAMVASMLVLRGERVLLVHDDVLKKWVFPNDHVRLREGVHRTALRAVKNLGLRYAVSFPQKSLLDVEFDKRWHSEEELDGLRDWWPAKHPEPFYVQSERQHWREGHSIHYDLIYVGCLKNDLHDANTKMKDLGGETRTIWVTLSDINSLIKEGTVFPDTAKIARLALEGPRN